MSLNTSNKSAACPDAAVEVKQRILRIIENKKMVAPSPDVLDALITEALDHGTTTHAAYAWTLYQRWARTYASSMHQGAVD